MFNFYDALTILNSRAEQLSHEQKKELERYIGDLNRRTGQLQKDLEKALIELEEILEKQK